MFSPFSLVRWVRPGTQHAFVDAVDRYQPVRHGYMNLFVAVAAEQGCGGPRPAPACTATSPRGLMSQPRPTRRPPGSGATCGVSASRASVPGSSDDHPAPRRTRSAAVAHSPPTAGMVLIMAGTGTKVPSGVRL